MEQNTIKNIFKFMNGNNKRKARRLYFHVLKPSSAIVALITEAVDVS